MLKMLEPFSELNVWLKVSPPLSVRLTRNEVGLPFSRLNSAAVKPVRIVNVRFVNRLPFAAKTVAAPLLVLRSPFVELKVTSGPPIPTLPVTVGELVNAPRLTFVVLLTQLAPWAQTTMAA